MPLPARPRPGPENALRIGLTVGDPAGIGPEITSKALARCADLAEFSVYGDVSAVERAGTLPGNVKRVEHASAVVTPGKPDPAASAGAPIQSTRKCRP